MNDFIDLMPNKNKANGQIYLRVKKKQLPRDVKENLELLKNVRIHKDDFLFN